MILQFLLLYVPMKQSPRHDPVNSPMVYTAYTFSILELSEVTAAIDAVAGYVNKGMLMEQEDVISDQPIVPPTRHLFQEIKDMLTTLTARPNTAKSHGEG